MRSPLIDTLVEETPGGPMVLGHRGVRNAEVTENTLAAFEEAFKRGARGIEIDVESTADGKLIVINRWFCKARLGFFPWEKDLEGLRAAAQGQGIKVPSFHDACRFMKSKPKSIFNVEIKSSHPYLCHTARKAVNVIRHHGIDDQVILSSFDINTLITTRFFHHTIETAYLFRLNDRTVQIEDKKRWRFKINTLLNRSGIKGFLVGADTLHPEISLFPRPGARETLWMKAARLMGKRVNAWTVDEPEEMEKAVAAGVAVVISDGVRW
ncbi:glycerophosphodiester phosphodiesterase [Desulfoluna spongiiphila]|nr:glycerophosphodiester phosphodiesterase [Desulfoluna spongiiphila]